MDLEFVRYQERRVTSKEDDVQSSTSTQDTNGYRQLLPVPKRDSTIMSAFVEAGLTSALPLLSLKANDPEVNTDSDDKKSCIRSREQDRKRKMNKKMRVVQKAGLTNVTYKNISKKKRKYISDLYTTLLDSTWLECVLLFSASFFVSWLLFGSIYYALSFVRGDLSDVKLDPNIESKRIPCIDGLDGVISAFLFSLETQHTIGYGTRAITTECPHIVLIMSFQCIFGLLLQSLLVGLIFSKLSRPRMRTKTVIFSQCAVINQRNKKLCLIFRIGDLRDDNFILGTQVRLTREDKILRLKLADNGKDFEEKNNI